MITSRKSLLCAGLLAATIASTGAFAQAPATTPSAPDAQAQSGAQPPAKGPRAGKDRAQRFEQMRQRHAQHLSALKEKLKLTPAQEGAWGSFAAAQQPPAPPAGPRMDRAEFAKLTTPQRLDLMEKRQAERSAMFAKRADATRSFYAGLTPDQQKTFDAESVRRFGPGERGGRQQHKHHPAAPARS